MGNAHQSGAYLGPTLARTVEADSKPNHSGERRTHAPGDVLAGKYQLIRLLEEGGMGVVWVAHNLDLDAHVALKLLRSEGGSPDAAERLLVEARAAARLDHPAIVRIFDVGRTEAGSPFLVMELLEGECLADSLARERRIDAVTAVRMLLPIAGALDAMHQGGMIHRDVKPENIFLVPAGSKIWRPKLIDLGLARIGVRDRITRRGMVIGTPGYMAPEQLKGEEVDLRTDIFAFCAVLYRTIAGVLPFHDETPVQLLKEMLANQPRSIVELGCGDAELEAILKRGFERPGQRWPTARELGKALARWLWDQGVTEDISGVALRSAWLDDIDVRGLVLPSQTATMRFPNPLVQRRTEESPATPEPLTIVTTPPPAPSVKPLLALLVPAAVVLALTAVLQSDAPQGSHAQPASPLVSSPEPPAPGSTSAAPAPQPTVEATARAPAPAATHQPAPPQAPRRAPPPRVPANSDASQSDVKDPYR